MTRYCLCFNFRAEKEKIIEKMKENEQQEEVDDSGFFAGKSTLFVPVCGGLEFISFFFHPL